jgi:hypothetical protein
MAIWTAPSDHARLCGVASTALRPKRRTLWRNAEVDHRVPLFRVWNEHRETPWPKLLVFWGLPNLQVINSFAFCTPNDRAGLPASPGVKLVPVLQSTRSSQCFA